MNKTELEQHFPLCVKYNAPLTDNLRLPFDSKAWIESLPCDWESRFDSVMGPVTCDDGGIYACDVEDTLWSLERGLPHRRWNG